MDINMKKYDIKIRSSLTCIRPTTYVHTSRTSNTTTVHKPYVLAPLYTHIYPRNYIQSRIDIIAYV